LPRSSRPVDVAVRLGELAPRPLAGTHVLRAGHRPSNSGNVVRRADRAPVPIGRSSSSSACRRIEKNPRSPGPSTAFECARRRPSAMVRPHRVPGQPAPVRGPQSMRRPTTVHPPSLPAGWKPDAQWCFSTSRPCPVLYDCHRLEPPKPISSPPPREVDCPTSIMQPPCCRRIPERIPPLMAPSIAYDP